MVRIRTNNELINATIEFYRMAKPQLDTKPATVARDLLIDGPATQEAKIYEELARVSTAQSLRLSLGQDLDRYASNFGVVRKQGSRSTGTAILTFPVLETDFSVNSGDLVRATNGASFSVVNSMTVSVVNSNTYRAVASKYRTDLDFVGITDQYAVESLVEATVTGTIGNISKYSLSDAVIPGVSNVTNAAPFSGGSNAEDDSTFKNRILAKFSGANSGTETGYRNAVLADPDVIDALVVVPGDTLMTRDGTQVVTSESGITTIVAEGTGGKVDIYAYGLRLLQILDSYIYRDKSNQDDPTNSANDFVLGQIAGDANKTVTRKRIDDLQNGTLPSQPVVNLTQVSGSSSGSNFVSKQTNSLGVVTGNYELIRDTGAYGGSPWGFDKIHWISNQIDGFSEDLSKGKFNGQDALSYSDVLEIGAAAQIIQVSNENSVVNPANRASIQLAHKPLNSVTRVFNASTGERYVVANQNPDGTGSTNYTGRILISGNTLPSVSDVLQVDYSWIFNYDPNFDFDNRLTDYNPRSVIDSIDWGYSNAVSREESIVQTIFGLLSVSVTHPISSVITVNTFDGENSTVAFISGRLAVVVTNTVSNVISVTRISDSAELFNSNKQDGSFSGMTIFLPTDTVGAVGQAVTIRYNANDIFTVNGVSGSFNNNTITLPASTPAGGGAWPLVECNYIANVKTILPAVALPTLPALRSGNAFNTTIATGIGTQPTTHIFLAPNVITFNLRKAPSRLQLAIAGSISPGVITVSGTVFYGVFEAVIKVANNGLTYDLSSAIRSYLGLSSSASIPANVSVVRLISVEKVNTTSSLQVLSVVNTYEVMGYALKDNSFVKWEAIENSALTQTEISLPQTPDNISNEPKVGDKLRVTFYIKKTSDTENVSFSKSGMLYTDKIFAWVDSVAISSGFTSGSSTTATLTISNQNQPISGTRYSATYNYLAPKANERITIQYNTNQVISDSTFAIEDIRIVGADVLVKAATPLLVDLSMAIVVSPAYSNTPNIVTQNVKDAIVSALNATALGTTVDESDFINVAYTVNGVDRVRPVAFNETGKVGTALSITAQSNQYIQANSVTITSEER
jgi:hypothetical protein